MKLAFSFFGVFAAPASSLREQLLQRWPDVDVVDIDFPISAIGLRFSTGYYKPSDEDTPEFINREIIGLSISHPGVRFLVLRTECWGGDCFNWGRILQDGAVAFEANGDGALRRLVLQLGVDIGSGEKFEPLRREFPWRQPQ
jgi:hypothetical protein